MTTAAHRMDGKNWSTCGNIENTPAKGMQGTYGQSQQKWPKMLLKKAMAGGHINLPPLLPLKKAVKRPHETLRLPLKRYSKNIKFWFNPHSL